MRKAIKWSALALAAVLGLRGTAVGRALWSSTLTAGGQVNAAGTWKIEILSGTVELTGGECFSADNASGVPEETEADSGAAGTVEEGACQPDPNDFGQSPSAEIPPDGEIFEDGAEPLPADQPDENLPNDTCEAESAENLPEEEASKASEEAENVLPDGGQPPDDTEEAADTAQMPDASGSLVLTGTADGEDILFPDVVLQSGGKAVYQAEIINSGTVPARWTQCEAALEVSDGLLVTQPEQSAGELLRPGETRIVSFEIAARGGSAEVRGLRLCMRWEKPEVEAVPTPLCRRFGSTDR